MSIKSGKTLKPSDHIRSRSVRMKASRLTVYDIEGVTEVRITPKEPGKATRIVSFRRENEDVIIECHDEKTLQLCPANRYGLHCSHAEKAITLLLRRGQRKSS